MKSFCLAALGGLTQWFTDPFAQATDEVGQPLRVRQKSKVKSQLSAFITPDQDPAFTWEDDAWKVPELEDLVVYELHVEEFNRTFGGVQERLQKTLYPPTSRLP